MRYMQVPIAFFLLVSFSLVIAPFLLRSIKWSQIVFVLMAFLIGFTVMNQEINSLKALAAYDGQDFLFSGKVEDYPQNKAKQWEFTLKAGSFGQDAKTGELDKRFKVSYYGDESFEQLKPGDLISFTGTLELVQAARNPGGFNEELYLKSKGIDGRIRLKNTDVKIIGEERGFFEVSNQVKNWLGNQFDQAFKPDLAALLKGVLFGEKAIDQEIKESFQNIGLGHILAVSGLHVGFLFLLITLLLKALKVKKSRWLFFVAPILFIYAGLTGFSASVLRASMMLACLIIGEGLAMEKDVLSNLALAGIIILVIWPTQLFQAGFQLSMAAVVGIIFFNAPLNFQFEKRSGPRERKITPNPILQTLILTASVLLGTLPISIYHFGNFTFITFLANMVMLPLTGFFVIGGFLFIIITIVFKLALPLIVLPVTFIGDSLLISAQALNRINDFFSFLTIQNASMDLVKIALFLLAGFLAAGYFNLQKKSVRYVLSAALILLLALPMVGAIWPSYLEVTMLDVGQGDSILVKSPKGKHYLIDGGGYHLARDYQISDRVLYPAFRHLQVRELDGIFLSHNHEDHKQGIEELIKADFPISHLFMGVQTNNNFLLEQKKVPVTLLKKGDRIETKDGIIIEILYPDGEVEPKADSEQNNASLVMLVSYGDVAMLFCGDMEKEAEQAILQDLKEITAKKDIQVLKVGHHGSKTSSTEGFIAAVDPELALISVGANNRYGHPNDEVLARLAVLEVLRTDKNGAIVVKSNGKWIRTKTYLN